MFKQKKGFILGFVTCILITVLITNVFAAPIEKTITAVYNNIKIKINGTEIDPKDANGNKVEPFIYNGTTYLPIRAVGEAFGMKVDWDDTTNTALLNGTPTLPGTANNSKVFEDSFVNKPLDEKWEKTGTLTFDGENGLIFSRGSNLRLSGFSIKDSSNITIEFEALDIKEASDRSSELFGFYFAPENKNWVDRFNVWDHSGLYYNNGKIANLTINEGEWNKIKVDLINNQANIYINDKLIISHKCSDIENQQFGFMPWNRNFCIRNFKLTIND